jgi:hypothetical protein
LKNKKEETSGVEKTRGAGYRMKRNRRKRIIKDNFKTKNERKRKSKRRWRKRREMNERRKI